MAKAKPAASAQAAGRRGASDRLVDAAESLLGQHGLDGVSLRQIGAAAGSGNNFAIQYHFGDIDGLIGAVLEKRMPAVDARQTELLREIDVHGRGHDLRALIDAFLRPLLEQVNAAGERSYARFISALLRSPQGRVHCKRLFHLTPATAEILDRLRVARPHLAGPLLEERLRWLTGMVCTSVFNRVQALSSGEADAALVDDVFDVAAAALAVVPANSGRGLTS